MTYCVFAFTQYSFPPSLHRNDCSHFRLPVVIRYAADYGQTRKEKFQTWAGLQWSSSGASALPKQPPSSVLQSLPFTVCPGSPLLTRSPLSLVAGR